MENLHPLPALPQIKDGKMARFGVRAAEYLTSGEWGFLFQFVLSKIVVWRFDRQHSLPALDLATLITSCPSLTSVMSLFFSQNDGYRSSHRCSRYSFSRSGYNDHSSPSCESSYRGHWAHYGR